MSSDTAHVDAAGPARRTGHSRRALGDAYDRHATQLFRLAHAICRDDDEASMAVAQAYDAAFSASDRAGSEPPARHVLARLTYLACTLLHPATSGPPVLAAADEVTDMQRRALLGLAMYGDHTYDQAATLLRIDPAVAAEILRTTLLGNLPSVPAPRTSPTQESHLVGRRPTPFGIVVSTETDRAVVGVCGEIDLCTAPRLAPVIHGLLATGHRHIVVNLDDVTFLDASALGALVIAHRDIRRSHGTLVLSRNPLCARLLAITGLTAIFEDEGADHVTSDSDSGHLTDTDPARWLRGRAQQKSP